MYVWIFVFLSSVFLFLYSCSLYFRISVICSPHGMESWYSIGTPESHTYERAKCCPYAGFFISFSLTMYIFFLIVNHKLYCLVLFSLVVKFFCREKIKQKIPLPVGNNANGIRATLRKETLILYYTFFIWVSVARKKVNFLKRK